MTLPKGWATATVEELAGIDGLVSDGDWVESKDQDPAGEVRLTQLADIGDGDFRDRSARFMTRDAAKRLRCTYLEPRDVLIARMPDPIGRACVFPGLDQPAVTAVDVMIWRTDGVLAEAEWFVRWINSPAIRKAMFDRAGGTTRQRIAGGRIKELELPVPPKAEQRRIVERLVALTTRLVRARAELDQVTLLTNQLRSTALSTARAELVAAAVSIADLANSTFDGPFGSNLKSADYVPSGVRVIRLENIGHLRFIADKESFISAQKYEALTRHTLKPGDILFSSFVDRNVRVCQVPADFNGIAINKADCFTIRPNTEVCDARFVTYMLASPETYEAMKAKVHGATRPRIGLSHLRDYELPLPDRKEQARIADQLDVVFARANRLEAEAAHAQALLDRLQAAILAKGFRGELVPQDPDDESASVLLAHLRRQQGDEPISRQRKNNPWKEQPMIAKTISARDRLLEDSRTWPIAGLRYEDLAKRLTLPHDEIRDALFELLSGVEPVLRQVFDKAGEQMILQRVAA
ncbi:restriction endonuclease subunit S [Mesorhizobium sp. M0119]|uniref:restriction endonuclease subunit S n=1 Tax=Mesorhizobium sp. M0119 TaxID=2956885 RepID=UPI00333D9F3A